MNAFHQLNIDTATTATATAGLFSHAKAEYTLGAAFALVPPAWFVPPWFTIVNLRTHVRPTKAAYDSETP